MLKPGSFCPQAHVAEAVEALEGSNIGLSSEVCRPSARLWRGPATAGSTVSRVALVDLTPGTTMVASIVRATGAAARQESSQLSQGDGRFGEHYARNARRKTGSIRRTRASDDGSGRDGEREPDGGGGARARIPGEAGHEVPCVQEVERRDCRTEADGREP